MRLAAEAALAYIEPSEVIGVGAGRTVAAFIRAMAIADLRPRAAVAASARSRTLLETHGIPVVGLADNVFPLNLYVDGADEADTSLRLVKGRGGALAREKVIATAARRFVCIVDESKLVPELGSVPLPVEVLPMSLYFVERELRAMGGECAMREAFETDNGNLIVDVRGLDFRDPCALEEAIDAIPGVVECGIFAKRPADVLVIGTKSGVRTLTR